MTGVTDEQLEELGIRSTSRHPNVASRISNAVFEAETHRCDFFAAHTVVDGNLVTGQSRNRGDDAEHRILEMLAEQTNEQ